VENCKQCYVLTSIAESWLASTQNKQIKIYNEPKENSDGHYGTFPFHQTCKLLAYCFSSEDGISFYLVVNSLSGMWKMLEKTGVHVRRGKRRENRINRNFYGCWKALLHYVYTHHSLTHHSIDVGDADPRFLLTTGNGPFAVIAMRRESLSLTQMNLFDVLHSADIPWAGTKEARKHCYRYNVSFHCYCRY
jgi:hypothetical protein